MLTKISPSSNNQLGSVLTRDEYRALDCMRAMGAITPDNANKLGIIDLRQAVTGLRAVGHDVRELTNDPRINPREYALTVFTLYDNTEQIQVLINRLSGFCLAYGLNENRRG